MAEEEKAAPQSGGEKKSKTILFVIIGIVVVLLLLAGLLAALLLSGGEKEAEKKPETQAAASTQPASQSTPSPQIVVGNTIAVRSTDKFHPGLIYPAEGPIAFKVNLMTQTGKKYLVASLQFELDKDDQKAHATQVELNKKLPMLKDTIIEVLSSKSVEDVATTKGKNRVKDEIVRRINELLADGKVYDVFFVEFVVS